MALPVKNRIKKSGDIDKVFKKGTTINGAFLFIKYTNNNLPNSRFAVIIPAKIYKKAASRNRLKRILTEQIRLAAINLERSYDIIISVKREGEEFLLRNELSTLFKKITRR